jgi:CubicO group peptidase (beta-lactamase class C family)
MNSIQGYRARSGNRRHNGATGERRSGIAPTLLFAAATHVGLLSIAGVLGVAVEAHAQTWGTVPLDDGDPVAVTVSCSNASNARVPCSRFGNFLAACRGLGGSGSCRTSGCSCDLPDRASSDLGGFGYGDLALAVSNASSKTTSGRDLARATLTSKEPAGVDLAVMEDEIRALLVGNAVGFAYVIAQNGSPAISGGWGDALRDDDGNLAMDELIPINIASVTKTITAVATLQLLEANGLDVESPISPWLPPSWPRGSSIDDLTFKHLLTHTSGWGQIFDAMSDAERAPWENHWDGIAYVVSQGALPDSPYAYKNANFAVLRMIIPALWAASGLAPFHIPELTQFNYGWYYLGYIQRAIFEPAGIPTARCWELPASPTAYAYDLDAPTKGGALSKNNYFHCGGHGNFRLNAMELAAFMAHIRYNSAILSPLNRLLMDGLRLGWNNKSNTKQKGRLGIFWHGGDLFLGSGREYHSCIMKFPRNVEATLLMNSDQDSGKTPCGVLKSAYSAAMP